MSLYDDNWEPTEKKKSSSAAIIVPIVVALIGLAGIFITASRTKEAGEISGRLTAIAELQPTIETLVTQSANSAVVATSASEAGKITGRQTAVAELQPTIDSLEATSAAAVAALTSPAQSTPSADDVGRLVGTLTDRQGQALSDVIVSVQNGPSARTDLQGTFVLNNVPVGDQLIVVEPPSGSGRVTLNTTMLAEETNQVNIIYDESTSRLGLLSITAPIDGGILEIRKDPGKDEQGADIIVHRATVFGRMDGLPQIFDEGYDIYVLVNSTRGGSFWLQLPAAAVDLQKNTWRATITLGDPENPPFEGEEWNIIAVAASLDTQMGRVISTPSLSLLPPHVRSNLVTAVAQIEE